MRTLKETWNMLAEMRSADHKTDFEADQKDFKRKLGLYTGPGEVYPVTYTVNWENKEGRVFKDAQSSGKLLNRAKERAEWVRNKFPDSRVWFTLWMDGKEVDAQEFYTPEGWDSNETPILELSTSGTLHNEPSWNRVDDFDKTILKKKPIITFTFEFAELGPVEVAMYKTDTKYLFVDKKKNVKIGDAEFKTIVAFIDGRKYESLECSFKSSIVGDYRGKGFGQNFVMSLVKYNTNNPGLWCSDTKVSPANKKVYQKLISRMDHTFVISNGRTPALWIDIKDRKMVDRFGLQRIVSKIESDPEYIWNEDWNKERIRIVLKD